MLCLATSTLPDGGSLQNPWSVLLDAAHGEPAINPGIREYTRVFILPDPVVCEGVVREVLLMGKKGTVVLLSVADDTPMDKRVCFPPGGTRPAGCGDASDQSTAVPLLTNGGELMVMGGCWFDALQRIDIYNVHTDTWQVGSQATSNLCLRAFTELRHWHQASSADLPAAPRWPCYALEW